MKQDNPGRILYLGPFLFPDGNAAAARVLGIGRCLRDLNYAVEFCGYEKPETVAQYRCPGGYEYRGFRFWPQNELGGTHESRSQQIYRLLFPEANTLAWMREPGRLANVRCIIVLSCFNALSVLRLMRFCRRLAIPLVVDCPEWQIPGNTLTLTNLWKCIEIPLGMRYVHKRVRHLIVISRFLQDYYASSGCCVVRVPPTVDVQDPKWPPNKALASESLRLVYAGSPERKDLLSIAVKGLADAVNLGINVSMQIIGPSVGEVSSLLGPDSGLLSKLGSRIHITGRLPHEDALQRLGESDFSILLRPDSRKSNAGFPTKVVESLASCLPVIANVTSDLGEYLHDGREMLRVQTPTVPSFVASLKRASQLSRQELGQMRRNARATAEKSFDYRPYTAAMKEFLGRRGV